GHEGLRCVARAIIGEECFNRLTVVADPHSRPRVTHVLKWSGPAVTVLFSCCSEQPTCYPPVLRSRPREQGLKDAALMPWESDIWQVNHFDAGDHPEESPATWVAVPFQACV